MDLGFNPVSYLKAGPDLLPILDAVIEAANEHSLKRDKRQAQLIASEVSKLFKRR